MDLSCVKLNTQCVVKSIEISDEKTKLRLMELGIIDGIKIYVKNKSLLKKTLLVVFDYSCFTLKDNIAKQIKVNYV